MPMGYTNPQLRYVNGVTIDQSGNSWVAFKSIGIGKYNGTAWTFYDSISASLPTNQINDIIRSSNNQIIAATANGISIFDGSSWQHFNTINSSLPASGVRSITENAGSLYAGTDSGLYIYNGSVWINYNTTSGLVHNSVTAVRVATNGDLWIATQNGLSKLSQGIFTSYDSGNTSVSNLNIISLQLNLKNEPWIINSINQLYYLDSSTGDFVSFSSLITIPPSLCTPPDLSARFQLTNINGKIITAIKNPNPDVHYNEINAVTLIAIDTSHIVEYSNILNINNVIIPLSYLTIYNNYLSYISSYSLFSNMTRFYTGNVSSLVFSPVADEFINQDFLDVNNVRTLILNRGDLGWDPVAQLPYYEIPKCSGKTSIYNSALWLGGLDQNNVLHTAAQTYRQNGSCDYWPGPIDTITGTTDSTIFRNYDRLWKINKSTIDDFIINFQAGNVTNGSYKVPISITNWPAHGTGNLSRALAPFYDNNSDAIYNPYDGDYPLIEGDQQLWWVFNDVLAAHTEANGLPFGFEIHGKAYAFNCSSLSGLNEPINYTTFYQYKIINRSQNAYHDMHIGLWMDNDLGNAADDYVGCNIPLNSGICYNADNNDDGIGGYGLKPPSQNVTILKGPEAPAGDGIDNNHNGTIDELNETFGITHFMHYNGINASPNGQPSTSSHFYNYLQGIWLDGLPVTYGGIGRDPSNPVCNFMFPGLTDPAFNTLWTMPSANILGDDMRMLISTGKFTIAPGEMKTIDFAYIYSRDTIGTWPADAEAKNLADIFKVQQWFQNNQLSSCPPAVTSIFDNSSSQSELYIYPVPAEDIIHLNLKDSDGLHYSVTDISGRNCFNGVLDNNTIKIKNLNPGVYHISVKTSEGIYNARFVRR